MHMKFVKYSVYECIMLDVESRVKLSLSWGKYSVMCVACSNNQLRDLPGELASLHLLREIAISCNRYASDMYF